MATEASSVGAGSGTTLIEQREGYGPPAPVPIFQWEAEFTELLELYRNREPHSVLEIGTYCGGTLYHWLQNAQPGTTVVTVDSYEIVARTGGVDNRVLYQEWVPDGVELVVLDADSRHFSTCDEVARHGPFDFIFIDAGHLYEEVMDDWENYGLGMSHKRCVVAFHDILPPSRSWPEIQVAWLWKEIKQNFTTREIIADRNAEWGGIGVVYL